MPLTSLEFAIAMATVIGLLVAVILLNRWRRRTGWWLLIAVVALAVIGNIFEKAVTGTSVLF